MYALKLLYKKYMGYLMNLEISDLTIIKEYKKNNKKGLGHLYERYNKYVYSIAYNFSGNKEDALDITQEVFISAFKGLKTFDDKYSLLPWIKKITVNKCINFKRSKKELVSLNETLPSGDEFLDSLESSDGVDSVMDCKSTKVILLSSINNLDSKTRMAILLRHMKNMKYEDIASNMKIPLGTVKTLIHNGRKQLKEDLRQQGVWGS